jgi:hypothetical protein
MSMTDFNDDRPLAERYLAMWNEPDPDRRRQLIRDTWAPDGAQILADPPDAARAEAADLRFGPPSFEVHGHDALEARVTKAYEMFIEPGDYRFHAQGPGHDLLPGVTSVAWELVSVSDGSHAGGGVDVLDLDRDGRIRRDYQFIQR